MQFKGEVEAGWCGHKYKTSHALQSEIYYNKTYILISISLYLSVNSFEPRSGKELCCSVTS